MMIYARTRKSKARKVPKAKQAEYDSWLQSVNSMSTGFSRGAPLKSKVKSPVVTGVYIRETAKIKSLDTGPGEATKAEPMKYTGDKMIGIATLHKSNAVPVFNSSDAVEISNMRR